MASPKAHVKAAGSNKIYFGDRQTWLGPSKASSPQRLRPPGDAVFLIASPTSRSSTSSRRSGTDGRSTSTPSSRKNSQSSCRQAFGGVGRTMTPWGMSTASFPNATCHGLCVNDTTLQSLPGRLPPDPRMVPGVMDSMLMRARSFNEIYAGNIHKGNSCILGG
eukprot:TRINITY_DN23077_c0_g1_i1.p1 TRINITY_DN23077_c0_g1~~TRINITY_DN23077_c0_g1_i1.p1  ORF type:complete len:163 (+),score=21.80 TRINITY_DN23077_c0_g1_i1:79-567(+)